MSEQSPRITAMLKPGDDSTEVRGATREALTRIMQQEGAFALRVLLGSKKVLLLTGIAASVDASFFCVYEFMMPGSLLSSLHSLGSRATSSLSAETLVINRIVILMLLAFSMMLTSRFSKELRRLGIVEPKP